jgi:hypothetical protein
MSLSTSRSYFAAGRVAILVACALLPYDVAAQPTGGDNNAKSEQGAHATAQPPPSASSQPRPPQVWDAANPCENFKGRDHPDLCQQWRLAKAAEATRDAAYRQNWILGGGAALLFLTPLAAVLAARSARIAVKTAADTAKRQLRPYVTPDSSALMWSHPPESPQSPIDFWTLTLLWKNCGQTPARNIQTWVNFDIFDKGSSPSDISFPDLGDYRSAANPLGPDQASAAKCRIEIDKAMAAWMKEKDLYFWAWIEYDGLNPRIRHRTEVCGLVEMLSNPMLKAPLDYAASVHSSFNAMDDECVHPPKTKGGRQKV